MAVFCRLSVLKMLALASSRLLAWDLHGGIIFQSLHHINSQWVRPCNLFSVVKLQALHAVVGRQMPQAPLGFAVTDQRQLLLALGCVLDRPRPAVACTTSTSVRHAAKHLKGKLMNAVAEPSPPVALSL